MLFKKSMTNEGLYIFENLSKLRVFQTVLNSKLNIYYIKLQLTSWSGILNPKPSKINFSYLKLYTLNIYIILNFYLRIYLGFKLELSLKI